MSTFCGAPSFRYRRTRSVFGTGFYDGVLGDCSVVFLLRNSSESYGTPRHVRMFSFQALPGEHTEMVFMDFHGTLILLSVIIHAGGMEMALGAEGEKRI